MKAIYKTLILSAGVIYFTPISLTKVHRQR